MEWLLGDVKILSTCKTKDVLLLIFRVNVIMRSRIRESRTYGSVRG